MSVRVDAERLRRMLEQVGACGPDPRGGYTRLAFGPEEKAARSLVANWLEDAGYSVRTDAAGNMIARKEGTVAGAPALAIGSHLDTVPQGGLFDGALGVVAAVECARAFADAGVTLRHPLEVIVFADEEGTSLGGTFGSRAMAGMIDRADFDVTDYRGVTFGERIREVGLEPEAVLTARRQPDELAAFIELHVEQGPVLDRLGIPVGIVSGIVGYRRFSVTITGQANHAGATPMSDRRDALVAAAQTLLALREEVMAENDRSGGTANTVLTVGAMQIHPGLHTIIPGKVTFPVDVRDLREEYLAGFESKLWSHLDRIGLPYEIEPFARKIPVTMSETVQDALRAEAEEMAVPYHRLPSGAGHDAMCMANLTPTGMIFVASQGGFSHCPEENTRWEDATLGAELLLRTVQRLDRTLG